MVDDIYWNKIEKIYKKQRKKGLETYKTTLEENDKLDIKEALLMLEEELIDSLMYIEKIKSLL